MLNLTQLRKQFSTQLTLSTFHIVEILTTCHETFTRFLSIQINSSESQTPRI